jgi:hypothetical protein
MLSIDGGHFFWAFSALVQVQLFMSGNYKSSDGNNDLKLLRQLTITQ